MAEALHLCALAFSATGTCCLVVDRRKARALEVIASVLMLLAMLDVVRGRPLLAPVAWAALLISAAMILAAVRGTQVRAAARASAGAQGWGAAGHAVPLAALPRAAMTSHSALGMVVMAVLVLTMSAHDGSSDAIPVPRMSGMHGHSGVSVVVVLFLFVVGYAVLSLIVAIRGHTRRDRIQYAVMGCSTAAMALSVLVQQA